MQTLMQGDAAALQKIVEYLGDEQMPLVLNFQLTCKCFYALAQQFMGAKFQYLYLYGERRFLVDRVLNSANYLSNLKILEFCKAPESAKRLLDKYCLQVETLQFDNAHDYSINETWLFPKLHTLTLHFVVDRTFGGQIIAKWIQLAPKLTNLTLHFENLDDSVYARSILTNFDYTIVSHIPKFSLFLDMVGASAAMPFANTLTTLSIYGPSRDWNHVASACTKLEAFYLDGMYCDWNLFPIMNQLVHLELSHVKFVEKNKETSFFLSLPPLLKKLQLSSPILFQFPAVGHLSYVEALICSSIELTTLAIPDWFSSMGNLKVFEFSHAAQQNLTFRNFPVLVSNLVLENVVISKECTCLKVQRMILYNCIVQSMTSLLVSPTLTSLSMNGCQTNIPVPFNTLPKLQHLALRIDSSYKVDLEVASLHLKNITAMHLTSCHIDEFPTELGSLSSLVSLDLSWNNISNVPASVWKASSETFTALRQLKLQDNPLNQYPSYICMPSLEELSLPVIESDFATQDVAPAGINRQEWTSIALQHMKYSKERFILQEELLVYNTKVHEALITYAIPMSNNRLLLNCHFRIGTTQKAGQTQEVDNSKVLCIIADSLCKKICSAYTIENADALLKIEKPEYDSYGESYGYED